MQRYFPFSTRFAIRVVTTIAVLFSIAAATSAAETGSSPPNILLVLSDDQSAPHVGCYGNKDIHTPTLDRLASEGMRFDRAYTTAPQCVPSRASILTGRHPIDIGITRFSAALPRDVMMFPELMGKQRQYHTGLCGRSYHLSGAGLNQPALRPYLADEDRPNVEQRFDYVKVAEGQGAKLRSDTLAQFEEFLGTVPEGRPFFLQLCWSDPHRPFSDDELPFKHDPAALSLPPFYPDAPAIRADLAAYYDEVARMDGNVGTVLEKLEEHKLGQNTIVIFMGDNGASQYRGKGTLNELGIHVPLIVRWPGVVKPGSSSDALISGDDLAPTLLQIAGIELPANLTGISFLSVLRGQESKSARTEIFAERGPHASGLPRGTDSFDLGRAIVMQRYKLIYNVLWQLPYEPVDFKLDAIKTLEAEGTLKPEFAKLYLAEHRPMFELYDLQEDSYEMHNLIGTPAARQIEQDLKGRLAAWMIHHRDFVPLPLSGRQ